MRHMTKSRVLLFGAMVILPLTHIVNVTRGVIGGNVEPIFGIDPALIVALSLVWLVAVTVFFFVLAINLMKKRLTT